jgi:hypothetical protein
MKPNRETREEVKKIEELAQIVGMKPDRLQRALRQAHLTIDEYSMIIQSALKASGYPHAI